VHRIRRPGCSCRLFVRGEQDAFGGNQRTACSAADRCALRMSLTREETFVLPVAELHHQSVLITGAARGLGRAMAVRPAQPGAAVGVVDIDASLCEQAAEAIRASGGKASAYAADVASRDALMEAARRFASEHAGLDAVINNAMLLRYEPISSITEAVADEML